MGRVVGLPQHPCPEAVGPPADAVGVIAVPLKYFVVVYTVHRALGIFSALRSRTARSLCSKRAAVVLAQFFSDVFRFSMVILLL